MMAAQPNPSELLIFGNPGMPGHRKSCKCFGCKSKRDKKTKRAGKAGASKRPNANHRPGCKCFACKHQRIMKRATPGRRRKDRKHRNPSETEQAVRLFETFHGKDAKSIMEKHISTMHRKDYTALGDLVYLKVRTPVGQTVTFDFDGDGVKLASSANGQQLYCIGGRQNLLPCLDETSQQKDFIDVGECLEVAYLARKIHSNYEPIEWFHKFGEQRDGSTKPQLMFNKLQKQIFFVGGEYFIDPKVDLSPGIEN